MENQLFLTYANHTAPVEESEEVKTNTLYLFMKRLVDIAGSLIGILVLLPLFIITAIAIKFDSKGPVLFSQERVGKNGCRIKIYKFRSMVDGADELKEELLTENEVDGPVFKIKHDPRVTKLGMFIRKTSIDELPQLINVLTGEMSLVGPRPPLPEEAAQYSPYQKQRLLVKPGLTCYWQISGRSNLSFEKWVELDLKYIQERNLLLDIKLILLTIPAVIIGNGAY